MCRKNYRLLASGLLLAALVLSVFPGVSRAKPIGSASFDPAALDLVGQIGGLTWAIAVQGNYAYAGIGPRLVIFDRVQLLSSGGSPRAHSSKAVSR